MNISNVQLVYANSADQLLQEAWFIEQWRILFQRCAYATACQTPGFVKSWYEEYREHWTPLIAYVRNSQGELDGVFFLAYNPQNQNLTHVGDRQAEYHVWLALADQEQRFLSAVWSELTQNFVFSKLTFNYLPEVALGERLKQVPNIRHRTIIRRRKRPLLQIDEQIIQQSFAKKSNKSRFNRLKKLGNLEFRRITDPDELEQVFDELIDFYDFRQGAVHNSIPFRRDPHKRNFYRKLFALVPSQVHLTVSYLDQKPIAALWASVSGTWLNLSMIMHSPLLAEHSVGKLHIMQLSRSLIDENLEVLDITPGDAPWKDRFASTHDEVMNAFIYRTIWLRLVDDAKHMLKQTVKRVLLPLGIQAQDLEQISHMKPTALKRHFSRWVNDSQELRVYRFDRQSIENFQRHAHISCNSLSHLLSIAIDSTWQTNNNFLSKALIRLESDEQVFTMQIDDRIVGYAWAAWHQTQWPVIELNQNFNLPPASVVLHDCSFHSAYANDKLCLTMISHLLHEIFTDTQIQSVYFFLPIEAQAVIQCLEKMGFQYQGSMYRQVSFGMEQTGFRHP